MGLSATSHMSLGDLRIYTAQSLGGRLASAMQTSLLVGEGGGTLYFRQQNSFGSFLQPQSVTVTASFVKATAIDLISRLKCADYETIRTDTRVRYPI